MPRLDAVPSVVDCEVCGTSQPLLSDWSTSKLRPRQVKVSSDLSPVMADRPRGGAVAGVDD